MPDRTRRRALSALPAAALAAAGLSGAAACSTRSPGRAVAGPRIARWAVPQRGFNIGVLDAARHDEAFLAAAAGHGARLLRMFLPLGGPRACPAIDGDTGRALERVLARAERAGLVVVLVPDLGAEAASPLWSDAVHADAFVVTWAALARELRGAHAVAGFDLLNEPNPPWPDGRIGSSSALWEALARRALQAIRAEDADVPVVLEGVAGGSTMGLLALGHSDDLALVYSLHFYTPHEITHQRVSPRWPRTLSYPNDDPRSLQGTWAYPGPWNRERLRAELTAAAARGRKDQLPVYVGEFSCVRWAPGESAANYRR
ncbi:MAG: glycoside hydrolase family 5 protein [Burkholderiaceae bacterium]|nr:glycoside hydrolase family 5 protein [Burkholderiaceae bacterium]